jgi:pimeloyl-ACP methyl ester carboxylesterase
VALLSVSDEALGERTSRVAVTPVYPFAHAAQRHQLGAAAALLASVGRIPGMKSVIGKLGLKSPEARGYTAEERASMYREFMRVPLGPMVALTREVARARPETSDRLDRCAIVVAQDDPLTPAWRALDALDKLGFPRRSIHHIASGGHTPHMEHEEHPEWTLRNVDDLARIVESMMVSAREGSPSSTVLESTVLAGSGE